MLILDDLHFLAGKRATQVEMMHTVETLLREGRQLVIAADRPPAEFKDFMPELVTRLSSGMVCRIEPPDFSTRLGIVATMCRRLGVELSVDVQQYVATQFTGHARELSGAICRLQAMSEATARKITLELAEQTLGEMIQQNSRVVRLSDIDKAVCKLFGLEPQSLQSSDKSRRVSQPRMLAMCGAEAHAGSVERDRRVLRPPQPQHGNFRTETSRSLDGLRRTDLPARANVEDRRGHPPGRAAVDGRVGLLLAERD